MEQYSPSEMIKTFSDYAGFLEDIYTKHKGTIAPETKEMIFKVLDQFPGLYPEIQDDEKIIFHKRKLEQILEGKFPLSD